MATTQYIPKINLQQEQKQELTELKCGLDYDIKTGRHYPSIKGLGPSAQTPDDCYGSPECFDVTIEIRGYYPIDFLHDGFLTNTKAVSEMDRALSAAKVVFTDIAPIAEIFDDPSFDVSGPHHFAYHKKDETVFFSCTYEGYEIC